MKVRLDEVCNIYKGKTTITKAIPGEYPLVVTAENRASHNEYQFDCKSCMCASCICHRAWSCEYKKVTLSRR